MANLRFTAGPLSGTNIPLERQTVIGRDPAVAQVVLADDDRVSREHARISPGQDGSWVIRDLGSTNGTWLIARDGNRRQLTGDHTLQNGDQIEIGGTRFSFSGGEMGATMLATSVLRLRQGLSSGSRWLWVAGAAVGGLIAAVVVIALVYSFVGGEDDGASCDRAQVADRIEPSLVLISTDESYGSGFALTSDGYIMTNRHVVLNEDGSRTASLEVILVGGRSFQAQVIGVDEEIDLALIKTEGNPELTPIRWAEPASVKRLLPVTAAGFPLGLELSGSEIEPTFTGGQISADQLIEGTQYWQHDASITNGNSGGPLVNNCAEVVGVNTAGLDADIAQGTFLAIASSVAEVRAGDWLPRQ